MPNYIRWGAPISVNTQTAGDQLKPSTIGLADGSFLVVWQTNSTTADGSLGAVKGQRYSASGAAIGTEFLINSAAAGNQLYVRGASLPSGGFVLTWESTDTLQDGSGTAVKAQLYDAAGAKVGAEFKVNTAAALDQQQPTVASLADGGFVVAWHTTDTTQDGAGWAVKAQRFDAAGTKVGSEFLVNTVTFGSQYNIDVAGLSGGGFVLTWQTGNDVNAEVYARAYNADGTPFGAQWQVSTDYGSQIGGRVAALTNGGFVITWSTGGGTINGIRTAIYDASGTKIGAEFAANTTSGGGRPDIVALSDGGFVIGWDTTGTSTGIRVQRFDAAGQRIGTETIVAEDSASNSVLSDGSITALSGGGFVVAWNQMLFTGSNGFDIRAQRFLSDTTPNTAPELGAPTLAVSVAENGTAVTTLTATDDNAPQPVSYSISGGADAALFAIDAVTGQLRFLTARDYEVRADADRNNVYEVIVRASDGLLFDTRAVSVTITNVNEAPVITTNGAGNTAAISMGENATFVTTVRATDPENSAVTYSIQSGTDAARFTINATTGVLSFIAAPDYEAPSDSDHNNTYQVTVRASDGSLADTQGITVTITNVNEPVVITSNGGGDTAALSVTENGLAVATVAATDPESAAIAYSIVGGADAARFTINAATGALSFVAAPDYEAPADANGDNVYQVTVQAGDGTFVDTQALSITVTNQDEAPVIGSNGGGDTAAVSVAENGTAVTTVAATDPEHAAISYSIVGGADAARFTINASTGALSFLAAPDYEAPADANGDNVYQVTVRAGDASLADTQALSVTVTNQNEAPVIGSNGGGDAAAVTVAENGNAVTTVAAADPEHAALSYSIAGGADAALFSINASTGELSFISAPDYEAPADANGDNVYQVTVRAGDGSLADTQALSVTVGNVVEGVAITSDGGGDTAAIAVEENGAAVTTVIAVNGEAGAPAYAIAGGADAALFAIDGATGGLTFLAAPDYEAPGDADADNVYEVIVSAGNGTYTDVQTLFVSVLDSDDMALGVAFDAFDPIGPFTFSESPNSGSADAPYGATLAHLGGESGFILA
ncbi:MAG: cadherin repeat domain-containing protein [Alphaproteobacteria bacterium]|nr:cadherin repeat domain-containing protein [Alphaproteobacteria bacterium]MBV9370925.1 cadherin repeat domain-containing protein [Alphaproteobacteria bacterium]MBV9901145.1 cadherin repeat domain-containing protein [Alphaproteobacteria bacterium]